MNATEFRAKMEAFAKTRNIPLNDILCDCDDIILYTSTLDADRREDYLSRVFVSYKAGFPVALPVGTTSLRRRQAALEDEN